MNQHDFGDLVTSQMTSPTQDLSNFESFDDIYQMLGENWIHAFWPGLSGDFLFGPFLGAFWDYFLIFYLSSSREKDPRR